MKLIQSFIAAAPEAVKSPGKGTPAQPAGKGKGKGKEEPAAEKKKDYSLLLW